MGSEMCIRDRVSRAREIIERMGARVVTPQEARNKLKLKGADA